MCYAVLMSCSLVSLLLRRGQKDIDLHIPHVAQLAFETWGFLVNQRRMIKAPVFSQCLDGCSPGATQNHLLFGVTVGKTDWNWIMSHREKCRPGLRHIYRQLFLSLPVPSLSLLLPSYYLHTPFQNTHISLSLKICIASSNGSSTNILLVTQRELFFYLFSVRYFKI